MEISNTCFKQAVILVRAKQTSLRAVFTSGSTTLGTKTLVPGYNAVSFGGLTAGLVTVKVLNAAGATVVSGTGPIAVSTRDMHQSMKH